jgi:hypothetical protein
MDLYDQISGSLFNYEFERDEDNLSCVICFLKESFSNIYQYLHLNKFKSSCYFQQLISRYLDTETELLNKYLDVRFEVSELCINT